MFQSKESCTHPTAWTWTKEPTWFSQYYHWDAWTVVKSFSNEDDNVPWYFSDRNSARVNSRGKFYLDGDVRDKAADSLSKLWLCVESNISNLPFIRGTDHLLHFNQLHLQSSWDSLSSVDFLVWEARAKAWSYWALLIGGPLQSRIGSLPYNHGWWITSPHSIFAASRRGAFS